MKSPEFQLSVACCRWSFARDDASRVYELCGEVDWDRFVRVARYHRIQGLVWNCLSSTEARVPRPAADDLASDARSIAVANLRIAIEARELRVQFEAANVPIMFVKGLTVGTLAYGNPMLKMGWDTDLLVDPTQLDEAARLLQSRGYRPVVPAAPADLQSWHRLEKESVWNRDDGLHVELHTRLANQLALIPNIDINSPSREVEVAPGIALPTLKEDELFAYLCVHGASSLWFRLKWITDLAAILHGVPHEEIERLYYQSLKLGAGRASGSALLLADSLYGTLGDSTLRSVLGRERTSHRLLNAALRQLAGRDEPIEPTMRFGGTAAIHYTQLLLLPGLRFKMSELARQALAAIRAIG
jgi:hypothetical protein